MDVAAFAEKLATLRGQRVTQATVAGNTLILWVGAEPKAFDAICLWLDPPWRIVGDAKFVVGSAEFPWRPEDYGSESEYKAEFERVCQLCRCTEGQTIERIVYDPKTADLELTFTGGISFRSFSTVRDEEHWHLSEYATNMQYRIAPGKVSVESLDA